MHKDKKGKVYASLTEVKNKTGDIFALVDEFGEVFITSYNKTRYKISKMDISSILSESGKSVDEEPTVKKETRPAPEKKEVVKKEEPKAVKNEEKPAPKHEETEADQRTISISAYDRNSSKEIEFINNALQPLVNN